MKDLKHVKRFNMQEKLGPESLNDESKSDLLNLFRCE
jgi:hypothetical protein